MLPSEVRAALVKAAQHKDDLERRLAVDAVIAWARDRFPQYFLAGGRGDAECVEEKSTTGE